MNSAMIYDVTVFSKYTYIVYGSVCGLVAEHKTFDAAAKSMQRHARGCKSQGGYSDANVYEFFEGEWRIAQEDSTYYHPFAQ